ncbi:MAG TPA: alpha/beta hydrolase [Trebonia sp.]|nr:alpha/beta hydrolase [Trebonia sp.]
MPPNQATVVLVHGAWADGSSWSKVIGPLQADGMKVVAAPLPLTTLPDDVAAVDRAIERLDGPIVLVGHAYAGAVIAGTRNPKVASLVYISGLAPEEGETVSDVFYRSDPDPNAPDLKPDEHGLIWMPESAFANAWIQNASRQEQQLLAAVQRPIHMECIGVPVERPWWKDGPSWVLVAEQDRMINPETQHFTAERMGANVRARPVDHVPLITAPDEVTDIIRAAVRDVATGM